MPFCGNATSHFVRSEWCFYLNNPEMSQLRSTRQSPSRRHSPRERRSTFRYDNKCDPDGDQEKRKKLSAREGTDQLRVRFAKIFNHDAKDRVANKEKSR